MSEFDRPELHGSRFLTGKDLIDKSPVEPRIAKVLNQLYLPEAERTAMIARDMMQKYTERAEDAVLAWEQLSRLVPAVHDLLARDLISIVEKPGDILANRSRTGFWWEVRAFEDKDSEFDVVQERRMGITTKFREEHIPEPTIKNEIQVKINLDGDIKSDFDGSIEMIRIIGEHQIKQVEPSHKLFLPYAGIALAGSVKVMTAESMNRALEILSRYVQENPTSQVHSER